jgi:hypothetical protein
MANGKRRSPYPKSSGDAVLDERGGEVVKYFRLRKDVIMREIDAQGGQGTCYFEN